jgi:hypothetical protein
MKRVNYPHTDLALSPDRINLLTPASTSTDSFDIDVLRITGYFHDDLVYCPPPVHVL